MKVVVLMGGIGARFREAGYETLKPLIRVDGKTILEHVFAMYPGADEYMLVLNENFVNHENVVALKSTVPNIEIVPIESHKFGPVYTLSRVWDRFSPDESVMVSYSDFNANWDFKDFTQQVARGWAGAIPSYTGFHPHLLHKKKYAGILADQSGRMEKIQEKHSFTENPEESYHSAGNYYFSSAQEMRYYGKKLMDSGETLNGEYYVSMMYYPYLDDGKDVLVYPKKHFLQWGTPEDLEEYEAWSRLIQGEGKGVTDIPKSREKNITIPYTKNSPEYKKSERYWREYFNR